MFYTGMIVKQYSKTRKFLGNTLNMLIIFKVRVNGYHGIKKFLRAVEHQGG